MLLAALMQTEERRSIIRLSGTTKGRSALAKQGFIEMALAYFWTTTGKSSMARKILGSVAEAHFHTIVLIVVCLRFYFEDYFINM